MSSKQIILTKGLPASGKTTWAEEFIVENTEFRNLNRDDLRFMLFGKNYKFSKQREKDVTQAQATLAEQFLNLGYSVIISDTNLNKKVLDKWEETARDWDIPLVIKDFTDVPLHVCLERDLQRSKSVGKKVINQMHRMYLSDAIPPYKGDGRLPKAVIFDIDGTLAQMSDRSPFDWAKVGEDTVINQTSEMLDGLGEIGYKIILLSGRDGSCREETESWLEDNSVIYDELFMRTAGDNEKDYIVKEDLFDTYVAPSYNVTAVVDDRPQVCRMWRNKGLFVFQVGNPDLDF